MIQRKSKTLLIIIGVLFVILYIMFPNVITIIIFLCYGLAVFFYRVGIADKYFKIKK